MGQLLPFGGIASLPQIHLPPNFLQLLLFVANALLQFLLVGSHIIVPQLQLLDVFFRQLPLRCLRLLLLGLEEDIAGGIRLPQLLFQLIVVHHLHGLVLDGHFVGRWLQTGLHCNLAVLEVRLNVKGL